MEYNLLESHKLAARWFVKQHREGNLSEEFLVMFAAGGQVIIAPFPRGKGIEIPRMSGMTLELLASERLIRANPEEHGSYHCGLLQRLFTAVDSDFGSLAVDITVPPEQAGAVSINLEQFRKILARDFNNSDLKTICFNMQIDYEDLPGENTLSDKTRELVLYTQRHGRLLELLIQTAKSRPKTDWASLY